MTTAIATAPPVPAPAAGGAGGPGAVRQAAEAFEATFLTQVLAGLFQGLGGGALGVDGPEGEMFGGLLAEEYAKLISRSGGIGLADQVRREMLRLQEVA